MSEVLLYQRLKVTRRAASVNTIPSISMNPVIQGLLEIKDTHRP